VAAKSGHFARIPSQLWFNTRVRKRRAKGERGGAFILNMEKGEQFIAEERLIEAKQERDAYVHKSFFILLEFAFVFGLPALGAFYLGRKLDMGTDQKTWTIIFSILAFVLSWVIVITRVKAVLKKLQEFDKKIRELKRNA